MVGVLSFIWISWRLTFCSTQLSSLFKWLFSLSLERFWSTIQYSVNDPTCLHQFLSSSINAFKLQCIFISSFGLLFRIGYNHFFFNFCWDKKPNYIIKINVLKGAVGCAPRRKAQKWCLALERRGAGHKAHTLWCLPRSTEAHSSGF